jgi:CubicO group peptidase (beta-lactamase class C family)
MNKPLKSITEKIDNLFTEWDNSLSPGCALAVIQNAQIVYQRGYGMANLEHDIAICPDTAFYIASMSKQFTAMSIALLVEQNALLLDDNIRKYLPEMPEYNKRNPVTLNHLIYHTSGIRDYLTLRQTAGQLEDTYTRHDTLELLARQKSLDFSPGERFTYSNSGYFLLSVVIERVSGKSLAEFANENIFKPLGMQSTSFHDNRTQEVKRRAAGHIKEENNNHRPYLSTFDLVGDGGIYSTVRDLFLWDQNFYHNRLGKGDRSLIEQLLKPGELNNGQPLAYAKGLICDTYKGMRIVYHPGSFLGYTADMIRCVDYNLTVICLANLEQINTTRLAFEVSEIVLSADRKPRSSGRSELQDGKPAAFNSEFSNDRPGEIELTKQEMAPITGIFREPSSGSLMTVTLEEGKLLGIAFDEGPVTTRLYPISPEVFLSLNPGKPGTTWEVTFEGDNQTAVAIKVPGGIPPVSMVYKRIKVLKPLPCDLSEYTGQYYSEELQIIFRIELKMDDLYLHYKNAPITPLKPVLPDIFRNGNSDFRFNRDEKGRVSGFRVYSWRAKNIQFKKFVGNLFNP